MANLDERFLPELLSTGHQVREHRQRADVRRNLQGVVSVLTGGGLLAAAG